MNHPTLVWICHQNQTISWLAWASRSLKPSLLEVEGGNRGHAFWYLAEMSALNQTSLLHHIFSRLHTQETRRVPVQQVHSRTTCPALPCTPVECWQVWSSLLICPSLICVQHIIGSLVQPTCCVDCFMHLTRLCMTSLWQFLDGSILLWFYIYQTWVFMYWIQANLMRTLFHTFNWVMHYKSTTIVGWINTSWFYIYQTWVFMYWIRANLLRTLFHAFNWVMHYKSTTIVGWINTSWFYTYQTGVFMYRIQAC
jgi:hypothetical protein